MTNNEKLNGDILVLLQQPAKTMDVLKAIYTLTTQYTADALEWAGKEEGYIYYHPCGWYKIFNNVFLESKELVALYGEQEYKPR